MEKRIIKDNSLGGNRPDYELKYDWSEDGKNIFVQGGSNGVVFSKTGGYKTAFIEAFPNKPKCFVRGEGKDLAEAEEDCWQKYQKILTCNHEMDRRDRTDGYAFCKHCTYSSTVFEPLTKCCKCGIPTNYTKDFRDKWYCKKHGRTKPKNPNPERWEKWVDNDRRLPRKEKKSYKKAFTNHLNQKFRGNYYKFDEVQLKKGSYRLVSAGKTIAMFTSRSLKEYIKKFG